MSLKAWLHGIRPESARGIDERLRAERAHPHTSYRLREFNCDKRTGGRPSIQQDCLHGCTNSFTSSRVCSRGIGTCAACVQGVKVIDAIPARFRRKAENNALRSRRHGSNCELSKGQGFHRLLSHLVWPPSSPPRKTGPSWHAPNGSRGVTKG